jgi:subtilase family serine protease
VAALALVATIVLVGPVAAGADKPASPGEQGLTQRPVCGPVPAGFARCHARILVSPAKKPTTTTTTTMRRSSTTSSSSTSTSSTTTMATSTTTTTTVPAGHAGLTPADVQSAYALPSAAAGTGQTVAVVDAYDAPTAEADLAVYRSYYGLPPCTTANGCFRKVDQRGGTAYPAANGAWAQEASLDIQVVSAVCPNCSILLLEADSNGLADLGAAVNTAATLGATAISNSYGVAESLFAFAPDPTPYNHPGIALTASTGDNGYGAEFPASSGYVTAVGGTSLIRAASTSRGWSETAWSGAGSGCSRFFPKPTWQADSGCAARTVGDVSAVADPNTGVAVYDSYAYQGQSGWLVFGGTSVGAPLVAAVYALAGNATTLTYGSSLYAGAGSLSDVVSGANGTCSPTYLCTAGPGYDGPTGLGTPAGTGAF